MQQQQAGIDSSWAHGYVIAVVGLADSIGKTTVTVNLAVGLARANPESKIAIVDRNPLPGDVGPFLNIQGEHSIVDLSQMIEASAEADFHTVASALVRHETGVSVLSVLPKLSGNAMPHSHIWRVMKFLRKHFDYIILDTPTILPSEISASPFRALHNANMDDAQRVIVVTTPTRLALLNARMLFDLVDEKWLPKDRVVLVLNKVGEQTDLPAEKISRALNHDISVQIPTDPVVVRAVNRGVPLIPPEVRPDSHGGLLGLEMLSPAASALIDLVQLLMKQLPRTRFSSFYQNIDR